MKVPSTISPKIMMWFGRLSLCGLSLCGMTASAHGQDAFDGHRLFFTEAQRKAAAQESLEVLPDRLRQAAASELEKTNAFRDGIHGGNTSERVNSRSADSLNTRRSSEQNDRVENHPQNYQVYFTGLVTGRRGVQILVNGLPCQFSSTQQSRKTGRPLVIDCPGVRNDALSLSLSERAGELSVTGAGRRVHQLLPGEGI